MTKNRPVTRLETLVAKDFIRSDGVKVENKWGWMIDYEGHNYPVLGGVGPTLEDAILRAVEATKYATNGIVKLQISFYASKDVPYGPSCDKAESAELVEGIIGGTTDREA